MTQGKLTKKLRRLLRKQGKYEEPNIGLKIKHFSPITNNQQLTFNHYYNGKNLFLHGTAGTGKSFISLYLALQECLESDIYKKVYIVRSVVPSRDMGFLPGNQKEKIKVYEQPYYSICTELFGRGDSYDLLKQKNKIEFISTSFLRGITFSDCIVVCDELQNMTPGELNTIITRIGDNCKVIFSGDIRQTDLNKGKEMSGIADFIKIIRRMNLFEFVEFKPEDICRSRLVKQYIMIRNELEDRNVIQPLSRM